MICNRPWQAFDDHIRNVCPTHLRRRIYLPKLKQAYLAWIRRPSHESIHPSFYELCLFPSLSTYLYTRLDNHQNSLLQEVGMEREGRGGGRCRGRGLLVFFKQVSQELSSLSCSTPHYSLSCRPAPHIENASWRISQSCFLMTHHL